MERRRALCIMEPPLANTGFGTVSRAILPALAEDFDITLLATGGYGQLDNDLLKAFGVKAYQATMPDDMHLLKAVDQMFVAVKPHVTFTYYDSGSLYEYVSKTHIPYHPHATYLVTESEPLMPAWCRMFDDVEFNEGRSGFNFRIEEIILASNYGARIAQHQTNRECVVAHHGVDHANWRRLPKEWKAAEKERMAAILKDPEFKDAFVLMYVARNADRKMWPRMFQAFKMAKEMAPDIKFRLFAYTKRFDNFTNEGWHLDNILRQMGLDPVDVFFPEISDMGGTPFESDLETLMPSMLKYYNVADLYVHPSGVEGCGLPILEAAKSGLPVLTTEFGAGWEYAKDFAMPIKVRDFYYHKSGIAHAMIDIEDCAKKIVQFARNKALWHQYSGLGMKRCNYKWADLGQASLLAANEAIKNFHPMGM